MYLYSVLVATFFNMMMIVYIHFYIRDNFKLAIFLSVLMILAIASVSIYQIVKEKIFGIVSIFCFVIFYVVCFFIFLDLVKLFRVNSILMSIILVGLLIAVIISEIIFYLRPTEKIAKINLYIFSVFHSLCYYAFHDFAEYIISLIILTLAVNSIKDQIFPAKEN